MPILILVLQGDKSGSNTVYLWYAEIKPVSRWLADHVNEGKSELNFSEFATYTPKKEIIN